MSATIGISNKECWLAQTWTFLQLLDDVRAQHPTGDALGPFLDDASVLQFIELHWDQSASVEVAQQIYHTASGILDGRIKSTLEVDDSLSEYKKSIGGLVFLFDQSRKLEAREMPGTA